MEKRAEILFVGGDERVIKAADVLAGRGHAVTLTGFEAYGKEVQNAVPYGEAEKQIGGAELIVLPLPYTRDGKTVNAPFAKGVISLEELFAICGSKPVLGGILPEKGMHADYYDEIMVLQNADVTAEAALLTAGARSGTTFAGGKALILGYGRIGKALANKLKALGCFVTVAARKEADRALAKLSGHSAVDCVTAETLFAGMDFVFNTVPTELFGEEVFDAVLVCPCTGNTLAKIANGITDTVVTMTVKAQLRNRLPVVLAVSTNDGLSANLFNIAAVLEKKHLFLVPFGQDDAVGKPTSLVCDFTRLEETLSDAVKGKQTQPILT